MNNTQQFQLKQYAGKLPRCQRCFSDNIINMRRIGAYIPNNKLFFIRKCLSDVTFIYIFRYVFVFKNVRELFREGLVAFEQPVPMTGLLIRWTGDRSGEVELGEAFDEFDELPVPVGAGEQA